LVPARKQIINSFVKIRRKLQWHIPCGPSKVGFTFLAANFFKRRQAMKRSCVATLSGLAFGAAVIVNAPHAWSQAGPGGTGDKTGSESRIQKPTDPPVSSGQPSPSGPSSVGQGSGMQSGAESRMGASQQWPKEKVKAIQEALKNKGFDPGSPDGVVGPKTGQALREFQKSTNLQVTGRIDDRTASALGVDAGGASSQSSGSSGKESISGSRSQSSTPQDKDSKGSDRLGDQGSSDLPMGGAKGGATGPSKPTGK
jgi:peptidoglycan hydrolase-like protein with peptidoglycan-binding domain